MLTKAFNYVDSGIAKFPDRLDIWLGKLYMLGTLQQYDAFTQETIHMLDYSVVNKNAWRWIDNRPLDTPENYFLNTTYDYTGRFLKTGSEHADQILGINQAMAHHYPQ